MQATFIKTFNFGGSVRTLFQLSRPLSDRTPSVSHVVRIYRAFEDRTSYLAAFTNGNVYCFSPICAADMAEIEAAVSSAHLIIQ